MELLLLMLSAHFIADFYCQPINWLATRRPKPIKRHRLWQHFSVHALLYILVFLFAELSLLSATIAMVLIVIAHALSLYWQINRVNKLSYFLIVQSIQILLITLVWAYLVNITLAQSLVFIEQFFSAKNIIIALSYLLVCRPASVIISLALKKHTDNLANSSVEKLAGASDEKNHSIGLLSAGAWIGYIERCLAISFIFMGQFAGIGFLVATKTIFRFGDLTKNKDMKLTEYMMLGTLLSYAIALFIGWNALQIYQTL